MTNKKPQEYIRVVPYEGHRGKPMLKIQCPLTWVAVEPHCWAISVDHAKKLVKAIQKHL